MLKTAIQAYIYTNTLRELERVASRLRRNGQKDDRTIEKLIDLDVITREMSSNSVLIQQRIEEYSQLIRDEIPPDTKQMAVAMERPNQATGSESYSVAFSAAVVLPDNCVS